MHISWNSSLYTSSVLWVIHLWKDIKSMGMRLGKGEGGTHPKYFCCV